MYHICDVKLCVLLVLNYMYYEYQGSITLLLAFESTSARHTPRGRCPFDIKEFTKKHELTNRNLPLEHRGTFRLCGKNTRCHSCFL